jgi:SAM-dependent methyltransferase
MSWFERSPETSLRLIDSLSLPPSASIVDVGGGASRLVAELLARGFEDLTVTDVSLAALARSRDALGDRAGQVEWRIGDIRDEDLGRKFDLWHDRALCHFQVTAVERESYLATLRRSLAPGGHALIATFGPTGPSSCSGLPVRRYGAEGLAAEFGDGFRLEASELVSHETPSGNRQQFMYAVLRRPSDR